MFVPRRSPWPLRATRAALVFALAARAAHAAPRSASPSAPDAEAVASFDEGRKLMAQGKYADAIPRFEESLRHGRTVGALLNLGRCYEETGRAASAWATYRAAASLAREFRDARESDATRFAGAIQPRVSTLTLDARAIDGVAGATVTRDGVAVERATLGEAAPVDPGEHVVEVSAPGKIAWRGSITVKADHDDARLAIPELADAPAPPPAPEPAPIAPASAATEAPPSTARTLGWIALGTGAAGIALGSVAGLVALGKHHDATAACPSYPDHCAGDGSADAPNASSQTWATASTVGFVAGGALAATGIVLLVTAPKRAAGASVTGARLAPIVLAGGGGVGVSGAW